MLSGSSFALQQNLTDYTIEWNERRETMNMNHLSERLAVVASFVPEQTVLADIGSDHAYLPCYLINKGIIRKAIAGEVVKGPYESAKRNVEANGLSSRIEVRLANGLSAVEKEDGVETVTIAGMGGTLIASILEEGKDRLQTVRRIIAQPNLHALAVRQWAVDNGFHITDEAIMQEDGKIYEVVVLERGSAEYSSADLLLGPALRKKSSEVFHLKWQREMEEWQRVIASLEQAEQTDAIEEKKKSLQEKYDIVREAVSS